MEHVNWCGRGKIVVNRYFKGTWNQWGTVAQSDGIYGHT